MAETSWWHVDCARKALGDEAFDLLAGCGYLTAHMEDGELYVDGRRVESAERVLKSMMEREDENADLLDEEEEKAPMSRVPQRYDPTLDPIAVGDKVTARQMLMDENGDVLARSGERLVVMGRDGPHWLLANGRGGRGRATTSQLRKSLTKGGDFDRLTRQIEDLWGDIPWSVMENNPAFDRLQRLTDNAGSPEALTAIRQECAKLASTLATSEDAGDDGDRREAVQVLRRMSALAGQALGGKKALTQADLEVNESNVNYYGTDLEDVEDEEVPEVPEAGVGIDDDEDRPEIEADDADPEDEGEGMVEIDPETGEPVRYLSAEDEAEYERTLKHFFWHTGIDIAQLRGQTEE
jgi:hypothetical protein